MDSKFLIRVLVLVVLLVVLGSSLVYFNIVPCSFYSSLGCEIYYNLIAGGKPKVLVVYGEEGLGDPLFLAEVLRSPKISARVKLLDLESVSLPLLQEYQLVIVEKAKKMSVDELVMFQEYVLKGGKLVWVGDAGSESKEEELLLESERKKGGKDVYLGPWARKDEGKQISFDYTLGVQFIANRCEIVDCKSYDLAGYVNFVDSSDKLSYGLSQKLPLYGNFSIVKLNELAYQKSSAYLDYGFNLVGKANHAWLESKTQDFGKTFPIIVTSGVGGRVAYYAFPPEYLVSDKMPIDKETGKRQVYWGVIENLYYGMLYK